MTNPATAASLGIQANFNPHQAVEELQQIRSMAWVTHRLLLEPNAPHLSQQDIAYRAADLVKVIEERATALMEVLDSYAALHESMQRVLGMVEA